MAASTERNRVFGKIPSSILGSRILLASMVNIPIMSTIIFFETLGPFFNLYFTLVVILMVDDTFAGVETTNSGIIISRVCIAQGLDNVFSISH